MEECWLTKPHDLPDAVLELRELTLADVVRFLSLCESEGIQTPPLLSLHTRADRQGAGTAKQKPKLKENLMNTTVVLITGSLTGIGRATAIAFAQEGARIVVSGRRDEAGQTLVAELREIGVEAEYWRADVRHEEDVRDLVDKTIARFGRLDVAVNAAGTEGTLGPVTE